MWLHRELLLHGILTLSTIIVKECASDDAATMAALIFEKDSPFVPVVSLSKLPTDDPHHGEHPTRYFGAKLHNGQIRAITSYEFWIDGCVSHDAPESENIAIYELSASVVRRPLGGFSEDVLSLQQVFIFVRVAHILIANFLADPPQRHCIMASVASGNNASLHALQVLGFEQVDELPNWLKYEHRSWFPNYDVNRQTAEREKERIDSEAAYLWLPAEAAKKLFQRLVPYLDGRKEMERNNLDSGQQENLKLTIELALLNDLRNDFGSIEVATERMNFDCLVSPPPFVRIGKAVF